MFSDETTDCYEFTSNWKTTSTTEEISVQCEPFVQNDVATEVFLRHEKSTQTDKIEARKEVAFADFDTKSVAAFLRRVAPEILDLLDRNIKSRAFDDFDLDFEEEEEIVKKIKSLCYKGFSQDNVNYMPKHLSWSSTGSSLAVSYGCNDHDGWCTHALGVCVWNLNRKDCNEAKPHQILETSYCIISLEFHPQNPAYLAAGSINGNVLLWNLNRDDNPLVWSSKTDDEGHSDAVTRVLWIRNSERLGSKYLLISAGLDGRILIWKQHDRTAELRLHKGFVMKTDHVPRSVGFRPIGKKMGITDISFNVEDPNVFVTCTEGGGVFQCSLDSQMPTGETVLSVSLFSPIVTAYKLHKGHVNSVAFSPFTRNVFATCGSDGELRFYSLLQPGGPVLTIHNDTAITAIRWSAARPTVVSFGTRDGRLRFCDLNKSSTAPVHDLILSEGGAQVNQFIFNLKMLKWIATCTDDGKIDVWRLGKDLTAVKGHEKETLIRLLCDT